MRKLYEAWMICVHSPLLWLMTTVIKWMTSFTFFLLRTSTPAHTWKHTQKTPMYTHSYTHRLTLSNAHTPAHACMHSTPTPRHAAEDHLDGQLRVRIWDGPATELPSGPQLIEQNCLRSPVHSCEGNARRQKAPWPKFCQGWKQLPAWDHDLSWRSSSSSWHSIRLSSQRTKFTHRGQLHSLE